MSQTEPKIPTNFTDNEVADLILGVIPEGVKTATLIEGLAIALAVVILYTTRKKREVALLALMPVLNTMRRTIDICLADNKKEKNARQNHTNEKP